MQKKKRKKKKRMRKRKKPRKKIASSLPLNSYQIKTRKEKSTPKKRKDKKFHYIDKNFDLFE